MKRTRIILLILSLLLIIIGCTNDNTTNTASLTTTKDNVTTTTVDNNSSTTSSKEITTTKEDIPTTTTTYDEPTTTQKPVTTTTKEVVTTTKENITTTQEPVITTTQEIVTTTEEIVTTTQEIITTTRHIHSFGTNYSYNERYHYKECECGETSQIGIHTFSNWIKDKDITDNEDGLMSRTCMVCGYKETKLMDRLSYDENYLFYELSSDMTYYILSDISFYSNSHLIVPSTFNNKPVLEIRIDSLSPINALIKSITLSEGIKKISESSFMWYSSIEQVALPSSIEDIGIQAFSHCDKLARINIPSSIKTIKRNVFSNCSSLAAITLTEGLERIEESAFNGCTSLTQVVLPSTVSYIGSTAFAKCISLTSIEVVENNEYYKSINGNLYDTNYNLIIYLSSKDETVYNVPENAKELDLSKLSENKNLETINIPSSLTLLVFKNANTESLKEININENNETYKSLDGVVFSKDLKTLIYYPRYKESNSYIVPTGTETIGENAFSNSKYLKSLTLPSSLKNISDEAFSYTLLTELDIPMSVDIVGEKILYRNSSIEILKVPFLGSSKEDETNTSVGYFFGQQNSRYIYFDLNITYIPDTLEVLILKEGCKKLSNNALKYAPVSILVLPNTIESIGSELITNISLPTKSLNWIFFEGTKNKWDELNQEQNQFVGIDMVFNYTVSNDPRNDINEE